MVTAAITLPRIDVFALLILAGAVQGMFLALMFFRKEHKTNTANFYLGLLVLAMTLCIFEIFLNYTGLMLTILWLDNFSEPFIFILGPAVFLYVSSLLNIKQKRPWIHFLWFGFYCLYHISYIIQPQNLKYDVLNGLYGFGLPMRPWTIYFDPDPFLLRRYVNEILAVHWIAYMIVSSRYVINAYKKEGISIFSTNDSKYKWLRNLHFHLWISFLIFVIVKLTYGRDLGDYLLAAYMAGCIYIISFSVVKNSVFFKPEPQQVDAPKYQKSSLTDADKDLIQLKLEKCIKTDKCFKDNLLSLNDLSRKVGVPSHHLSQVINETYQKTFFEYIAEHRINEAKELLCNPSGEMLTVEEIAEQVGYNSKSAFNKAFKKLTNLTPSEYRENTKK